MAKIADLEKELAATQKLFSELQSRLATSEANKIEFDNDVSKHADAVSQKFQLEAGLRSAVSSTQARLFSLREELDSALDEQEKSDAKARLQGHQDKLAKLAEIYNQQQSELVKTLLQMRAFATEHGNDYLAAHGTYKYAMSSDPDPASLLFASYEFPTCYFQNLMNGKTAVEYRQLLEGALV